MQLEQHQKPKLNFQYRQKDTTFLQQQGFIYFHVLGQKVMQEIDVKKVPFSLYIHYYDLSILTMLLKYNDWWAILPTFQPNKKPENNGENIIYISDVQLTLTGGIQQLRKETPLMTTIRQIKQQIGINVEAQKKIGLGKDGQLKCSQSYRKKIYLSVIPINNLKYDNIDFKIQQQQQLKSKYQQKIQTWVLIKNCNDPILLQRKTRGVVCIINVKLLRNLLFQLIILSKDFITWDIDQDNELNYSQQQNQSQIQSNQQSLNCQDFQQKINYTEEEWWTSQSSLKKQDQVKSMYQQQIVQYIDYKKQSIHQLAQVQYGNYVFMQLCKNSNQINLQKILKIISPNYVNILRSNKGPQSCIVINDIIFKKKYRQSMKILFKIIYKNFYQLAKFQKGNNNLLNCISQLPIDQIVKLKGKFKKKYLDDFNKLMMKQKSDYLLSRILYRAQIGSMQGNDNATKLKYKIINRIKDCFFQLIEEDQVYLIQFAYKFLRPKDMEPITKLIFDNFYLILKKDKFLLCSKTILFGIRQFWRHPFYHKYFEQLTNQLDQIQIKLIYYKNRKARKVLQQILKLPGNFKIKTKIADAIFNQEYSKIAKFIPKDIRQAWKQKKYKIQMQFQQKYIKIQNNWVVKNEQIIKEWLDQQIKMQQNHQQRRKEYLKNYNDSVSQ